MKNNLVQVGNLSGIKILSVKQFEDPQKEVPDFKNRYRKVAYFFRREGIASTLRKMKAYKYKAPRYLSFLTVEIDGKQYINASIQATTVPEEFVIKNEFFPFKDIDYNIIQRSTGHFIKHLNQFESQMDYSLVDIDASHPLAVPEKEKTYHSQHERGLFIFGLGGYVMMYVMHHFKKLKKIACVDYKAGIAENFKKQFGFEFSFTIPRYTFSLIKETKQPVAIIATYHADHAKIANEIFQANPKSLIFIEKPPAVTLEDLAILINLYNKNARVEIGFNRRFIDFSQYVKQHASGKPLVITCSVKEVLINDNHWYLWSNQGTRITGNAVHWFDLANMWTRSIPVEISLVSDPDDRETASITVRYQNGSLLNLVVSDKGNSLRGVQERIEIRFENETIFIDDFTSLEHTKADGSKTHKSKWHRDKGHNLMYRHFNRNIQGTTVSHYTVHDLINTSVVTYYAAQMLKTGLRNQQVEEEIRRFEKMVTPSTEKILQQLNK